MVIIHYSILQTKTLSRAWLIDFELNRTTRYGCSILKIWLSLQLKKPGTFFFIINSYFYIWCNEICRSLNNFCILFTFFTADLFYAQIEQMSRWLDDVPKQCRTLKNEPEPRIRLLVDEFHKQKKIIKKAIRKHLCEKENIFLGILIRTTPVGFNSVWVLKVWDLDRRVKYFV